MDLANEVKTIKYPFVITMREFCKLLDRYGINVDPLSISYEGNETTVTYINVSVEQQLALLGTRALPLERLISKPEEPTKLDISIWELTNDRILVEKDIGRYWTFVFGENKVLIKLVTGATEFHRSTSTLIGGFADSEFVTPTLRFFHPINNWEFESIFLGRVFDDEERSDKIIVSGTHYEDQIPGEEDLSCIGRNYNIIAWKFQTFSKILKTI